jgi:aspartate-semialdehyde dehydrogenase
MLATRKILSEPDLAITATCVRVPVLRAHTESINLTLKQIAETLVGAGKMQATPR